MSSFYTVSIRYRYRIDKKARYFRDTHKRRRAEKKIVNRSNEMNGFDTLNLSGYDMYHGF